jgi:hypothetical protein
MCILGSPDLLSIHSAKFCSRLFVQREELTDRPPQRTGGLQRADLDAFPQSRYHPRTAGVVPKDAGSGKSKPWRALVVATLKSRVLSLNVRCESWRCAS